jgi:hypothetical protein
MPQSVDKLLTLEAESSIGLGNEHLREEGMHP